MSKLNINAHSFTPPPLPPLAAPATPHSSLLQVPNATPASQKKSRGSHTRSRSSRNRPGQEGRHAQTPSPRVPIAKATSSTPKVFGPLTESKSRRATWQDQKIKDRKSKKAEKNFTLSPTSWSTTPSSKLDDTWYSKQNQQDARAWTSASGIGDGSAWGKNNGRGYGGVMYSGFRDMKGWEHYEQKQLAEKQRRELGLVEGPAVGDAVKLQKAYQTGQYIGWGR